MALYPDVFYNEYFPTGSTVFGGSCFLLWELPDRKIRIGGGIAFHFVAGIKTGANCQSAGFDFPGKIQCADEDIVDEEGSIAASENQANDIFVPFTKVQVCQITRSNFGAVSSLCKYWKCRVPSEYTKSLYWRLVPVFRNINP